jgi:chromosome segregation ATPase
MKIELDRLGSALSACKTENDSQRRFMNDLEFESKAKDSEISRMKKIVTERNAEINKLNAHFNEYTSGMRESTSKIMALDRERESLKKTIAENGIDLKDLREKILKKENEVRHLKGDFKNMSQDCAKLNGELIELRNSARLQKKPSLGENGKKKDTLTQIQRELFDANSKITKLDEKLSAERGESSKLKKEILTLKKENSDKEKNLQRQTSQNLISGEKIEKLKTEIMAGKRALQRLRENKDLLQSEIKDDHDQINSHLTELQVSNSHRSSPNKLVERLQLDNELLTKTVDDLQSRIFASGSQQRSNSVEKSKFVAETDTLKRQNRNLEENLAGLLIRNQI